MGRKKQKHYDCKLGGDIPELEIVADSESDAKRLFLEAVLRALTIDLVEAIEIDLVD